MSRLAPRGAGPFALGIHWAHDAAAAICSPDGVLCSIPEGGLTRVKHHYGFPCRAIEAVLEHCGLSAADLDVFAISTRAVFYPEHINRMMVDADGTLQRGKDVRTDGAAERSRGTGLGPRLKRLLRGASGSRGRKRRDPGASWGEFSDRHYANQRDFLRRLGLMDERIAHFYVHHHRAHAASAFRLSGLDEACIITVDGKGDGFSATIYRGHPDGTMELLRSTPAKHSIGSFYQAVTEALGFVPVDSEYKTMGLAAMGETTQDRNPFTEVIRVEDGVFRASIPWDFRRFNDHNPGMRVENPLSSVAQADDFKRYLVDLSPEQLAYFAQDHFEKNMLDFVRDALRIAQSDQLVGAGGALLNVKANALIRDELRPADFFVFPDAGDSGLAAGAALEALHHVEALSSPPVFANPYLGHGFDEADLGGKIAQRARTHDLRFREVSPDDIAEELIRGKAIGTFQGRLEMGPRALGNRSVLADPRSNAMKDRINGILKGREWFVPFAPAVLRDDAHLFWKGSPEYRYMTFAVEASEYAKKTVPAVVHVDGTMRPQVVSPESNFWLYQVLQSFKKRTGVGVLLNTSFNRHGVPIVAAPEDAFEHLENGWVDGLSMARWYIERRCSPQCKP